MNEKASLLNQLKIDRGNAGGETPRWRWWMTGGAAVLVIGGVAGVVLGDGGIPVHAAVAKKIEGVAGTASAGGSLLDASGYVVARRQATVSAKVTGKVAEVMLEEGQRVEKDQIIARLDDSNARAIYDQAQAQVRQAEANLFAAKVAYDNAKPLYERSEKLVKTGWVSGSSYDTAKATYDAARTTFSVNEEALRVAEAVLAVAQRNKDDMTIRAPFSGVVTVKAAQPGEMVSPNSAGGGFTRTGIGTIVDMDSLEVEVDVSESFISRVHGGQPVTIKLNAYPDWQIPGAVIAVIPTADRAKATVKVRVAFKDKDARVVPEMGARVSFLDDKPASPGVAATSGFIVQAEAVQANGETGVIFVIHDKTVERRAVRLGARSPEGQVILSGVSAGDRLAVGDFAKLADKVKVKVE